MNKDQLFPLIFGLVLGILLMFFWDLGSSLNDQGERLNQLERAANTNSQNIDDIKEIFSYFQQPVSPEGEVMDQESPMIIE